MDTIEKIDEWRRKYSDWQQRNAGAARDQLADGYPFVENKRSPFTPARRALPMLNLALISTAGAYIDGTNSFDVDAADGDATFREIPIEVGASDLKFAARGYDPQFVEKDMNSEVPIDRLTEFAENGVIGQLNPVWWSFCGFIPNAALVVDEMLPNLVARIKRYDVQAALLIPASELCQQSVSLVARALEQEKIPTMVIGLDREMLERVRPPRSGFYDGKYGCVAGSPLWPEQQRRVLDEALRWIEPIDQPTVRKLVVELQSEVEMARGER